MTSRVEMYLYYHPIELNLLEGHRVNFPMYRSKARAFKGTTNNIDFSIKDGDRKAVKVLDGQFKMYVFDNETDEVIVAKYATTVDEVNGKYTVVLNAGDIQQHRPGYYRYSVVYTDFTGTDQMLYTDLAQDVLGELEIVDDAFPKHIPATVVKAEDFLPLHGQDNTLYYTTGRYPGDAQDNSPDGLHTIALYLDNFTGTFQIQGSLEDYAAVDADYFNILSDGSSPFVLTEFTGIKEFKVVGSYIWLRFQYTKDVSNMGSVTQLLYKH